MSQVLPTTNMSTSPLKWLVWGHRGWIGQMVVQMLISKNQVVIGAESRADDQVAVEAEILLVQPDRLISLIGRTHGKGFSTIDYLEQPGNLSLNIRDNLWAPLVLANEAVKHQLHLTYLGTGCIFAYDQPDKPNLSQTFAEEDPPNFFGSGYSTVKGYTDRIMHLAPYNEYVLNARIRMPIDEKPNPRNLVTKLVNYEKICSIPNSMTVLPELLPVMLSAADRQLTGTLNLSNPGVITHNEILDMYTEIVDPSFKYQNFTLEEQSQILAAGRSNNMLDTSLLESFYPKVLPIKDSVRKILQTYKDNLNN